MRVWRDCAAIASVLSTVSSRSTLPTGWTEVYYNGKWRICDPDYQLPSYHKPAYHAYMMDEHDWDIRAYWKSELVIKNGKAVWQ